MSLAEIGPLVDGDWILNSDYSDDGVRLLQVGDVGINYFRNKSSRFITPKRATELRCTILQPGDVLISRMPDPIGRACILPNLGYPCITAVDVSIWRPSPAIADSEFVTFFLNTRDSHQRALSLATGATRPRISRKKLEQLEIPLPSLSEQQRIAGILKEQMAEVEKARAAAEARLEAARALPAAYLREVFQDIIPLSAKPVPHSGIRQWAWHTLSDIARLESGHTPSRNRPEWWGGNIPWIALPDIRKLDGKIADVTAENTNPDGIANSAARVLPAGTVCLSRTASVGYVAIMGKSMATSQDFVNWVCGDLINSKFLMYLLIASRFYIRSLASGATHQTVYMPTLESFKVCIPKVERQSELSDYLDRKLSAVEKTEEACSKLLNDLCALPAALLRKAFNGEL